MWWILFAAIDLYIALIILDVMARSGSVPPEKMRRLAIAKKILIAATVVLVLIFFAKLGLRHFGSTAK
jgi:hypothetical protein